jgi:hypothetical protein
MFHNVNPSHRHFRLFPRQSLQDSIRYLCPEAGASQEQEGLLINQGLDGVCFEAPELIRPRARLYLMMPDQPQREGSAGTQPGKLYLATVRWCRELESPQKWPFGIGAKFLSNECEWCGERFPYEQIHYTESRSILCDDCLRDLDALQSGRLKLSLTNHLLGNVI